MLNWKFNRIWWRLQSELALLVSAATLCIHIRSFSTVNRNRHVGAVAFMQYRCACLLSSYIKIVVATNFFGAYYHPRRNDEIKRVHLVTCVDATFSAKQFHFYKGSTFLKFYLHDANC